MALEVEYFGITGMVDVGSNDYLYLKHAPTTGPNGDYDLTVDPTDGPAQRYDIDFGVTHLGATAAVALDLVNSDIKSVMNNYSHGVTGVLYLRVVYNY
jgi:hypothetical protein